MHVADYIAGFIKKGFLWGMRRIGYRSFIITDPFMKMVFYSYLAYTDDIHEFFPDAEYKLDIWMNMPQAFLYGIQELPLPHLLYRRYDIPPFTDEPLILVVGDFNYASKSYARSVIMRELENVRDMVRKDFLNVLLINTRHEDEVEESIGCILAGSIFRAMGFLVDITGYPGHGFYLEKQFVRGHYIHKYPDIMAWRTETVTKLRSTGIINMGAFLPELTIYSLYGPVPRVNPDVKLPSMDADDIIAIGEVEPSYRRAYGGYDQALKYDSLGQADFVFLIAPNIPGYSDISYLSLNPFSLRLEFKKSVRTDPEKRNALKYILDVIVKSSLLLNIVPEKIITSKSINSCHDLVALPITLSLHEILKNI